MATVKTKEINAIESGELLDSSSAFDWSASPTVCPGSGCLTESFLIPPDEAAAGVYALSHDTHLTLAYESSVKGVPEPCAAPAESRFKAPTLPGYEILGELG